MSEILEIVKNRDPHQPEFIQAVTEVVESVQPVLDANPEYRKHNVLERLVEPERVIMFRVPWVDDEGNVQVNRAFRVQMNSAIGPYKGGCRFHPSVSLSSLKFLAFEQVFKNALTTLPMGGGKAGSDFDPKGKSDNEVMRFCQSFMAELFRHIGPNTDVPAGDIGVGAREIGFMFGMYKKLTNEFTGVLTGKGLNWGGSLIRPEATGYGAVYFLDEMLKTKGASLEGKTVSISGYGNAGTYVIEKVNELGGKVVTIGDEHGYVYDPEGIKGEKLKYMADLWTIHRRPAKDYADKFGCEWIEGKRPWEVPVDVAMPTAIENELHLKDAETLVKNGCKAVVEVANMPCTLEAAHHFKENGVLFAPAKAANAGGVATSGLEMSQNSMRLSWSREEVDTRLKGIMSNIHGACLSAAEQYGMPGNYVAGANIAGFVKVVDAMIDQGVV
ncbi:MAG: NADP-specific glutamate dehydrogenase [Desulfobacterales bacterium]|nr:NADP-specific glutamate dehydrogenase [Desulfobacterales bacterium]